MVMGVGFVGAVMAAIVADSVDKKTGKPEQVRHRLPAAQPAQLLEDPAAQPRRVAGQGRGSRGRPDDRPLRARRRRRSPPPTTATASSWPTAWWWTCSATTPSTTWATCAPARPRWPPWRRPCGPSARRSRRDCLVLIETTVAPGHDRVRRLADHEEGLRGARHRRASRCWRTASSASCRAASTSPSIRDFWRVCSGCNAEARERVVKFLREVLNTEKFPLTVMDRPIESRDDEDRRELLPRHDPRVPQRVEPLRRAQRRGPDQGDQGHQDAADAQQHHLPRPGHRRLLPAQGRRPGLLGLQAHPRLRGRRHVFKITPTAIDINDTRGAARGRARRATRCATWAATSPAPTCCSAAPATARTWATRATAARSWSSASSPRWAPRCASTTRTSSTGTSWRARTTTRRPAILGALLPQPGRARRTCACRRTWPARCKGAEAVVLAVPHEPYLELDPDEVVQMGRRAARRDRLLRHPRRRQDPPLLRARLRGEGPRPRPHPADQGRGAEGVVTRRSALRPGGP